MDADPGGMGLLVVVLAVEADAVDAVAMLLSALVGLPVVAAAEGADKNEALLPPTGGEKDTDVPAGSELLRALLPPPPFAVPPLALALPAVRRKGLGSRLLIMVGL